MPVRREERERTSSDIAASEAPRSSWGILMLGCTLHHVGSLTPVHVSPHPPTAAACEAQDEARNEEDADDRARTIGGNYSSDLASALS